MSEMFNLIRILNVSLSVRINTELQKFSLTLLKSVLN